MALCWGEGHGSAIHDHANSHCFMKMLQGSLEEIRFAWPEKTGEELKEIDRNRLNVNEVTYINGKFSFTVKDLPINKTLFRSFIFFVSYIFPNFNWVENE